MAWVKICGIANREDALTAVEVGADALGFVFYEKSPRHVSPQTARDIARDIPGTIEKVGVFVGSPGEFAFQIADEVGLTAIQTHVSVSFASVRAGFSFPLNSVKQYVALSARDCLDRPEDLEEFLLSAEGSGRNRPDAFFLDSGTSQTPGGTGQVFDWEKTIPLSENFRQAGFKLVVAGGLNAGNVAEAMRTLRPWGVDVSSGVEAQPGKKDPEKIRAFLAAVRKADEG